MIVTSVMKELKLVKVIIRLFQNSAYALIGKTATKNMGEYGFPMTRILPYNTGK